ncbi:unnamed protein product [Anisakis simplex]|uniref:F-BAR domain-containing protein n=1 Tax=Anisakis simplex TaxID=6269 RepID=A0A0M3KDY3_ANISI|nr:unnamed protein product [Anisakis simplex]
MNIAIFFFGNSISGKLHLLSEKESVYWFICIPFDEPSCSEEGTTTTTSSVTPINEDTGGGGSGSRRGRSSANARKSIFFGKDKADMLNRLTTLRDEFQRPVAMFQLEEHWTQIVHKSDQLSKRAQEQQEAIWEFVTTEHRYLQVRILFQSSVTAELLFRDIFCASVF